MNSEILNRLSNILREYGYTVEEPELHLDEDSSINDLATIIGKRYNTSCNRIHNALISAGFNTVKDIVNYHRPVIYLRHVGKVSAERIENVLKHNGLNPPKHPNDR